MLLLVLRLRTREGGTQGEPWFRRRGEVAVKWIAMVSMTERGGGLKDSRGIEDRPGRRSEGQRWFRRQPGAVVRSLAVVSTPWPGVGV